MDETPATNQTPAKEAVQAKDEPPAGHGSRAADEATGDKQSVLSGDGESYWMHTSAATSYAPLDGDLAVDVAVVGGGIAGLCSAWELLQTGRSVVVLEAGRIVAGVTGHTTAKLTAQHGAIYAHLERTRGPRAARHYAQSQQEAVEHVVATAGRLGIDCELERAPSYVYTMQDSAVAGLRTEAEAARKAGLDAVFTDRTGLPFAVAGAVRVEHQAQFHPRAYLLALAAEFVRHGGRIHEGTRITGLSEGEPCRLATAGGQTVTAHDVVVATHYPVFDRALLFTRLAPRRELVVAAPLDEAADPGGMYITDEEGKRSVRTAPLRNGERLLIVTGESFTPGAGEVKERYLRLEKWLRERFPVAGTTYRWAAQDIDPSDTVAMVGPFHSAARHTYVATGFGGWGMSGGVMAGRLLSALIEDRAPDWARLYDPRRMWPPLREAPTLLRQQADVAQHFVGDRLRAARSDGSLADLAPGEGAVVRVDGVRCAVQRDEEGGLHAVSARCTHLGCLVAFNEAERTWECPCHGSRFGRDGEVLQGPALRPLERRDVD